MSERTSWRVFVGPGESYYNTPSEIVVLGVKIKLDRSVPKERHDIAGFWVTFYPDRVCVMYTNDKFSDKLNEYTSNCMMYTGHVVSYKSVSSNIVTYLRKFNTARKPKKVLKLKWKSNKGRTLYQCNKRMLINAHVRQYSKWKKTKSAICERLKQWQAKRLAPPCNEV